MAKVCARDPRYHGKENFMFLENYLDLYETQLATLWFLFDENWPISMDFIGKKLFGVTIDPSGYSE